MACPVAQVSEFVKSVCRRILKVEDVWGSRHNHNLFMRSVDLFMKLGRAETFTVRQLTACYKTRDLPWLCGRLDGYASRKHKDGKGVKKRAPASAADGEKAAKRSRSDGSGRCGERAVDGIVVSSNHLISQDASCEREHSVESSGAHGDAHELLKWFIYWVFTDVVIPVVTSAFYVTEGEGTGTETLYFRKSDWQVLSAIGELQMKTNFVKVINDSCV
jgi:hypothetical protein